MSGTTNPSRYVLHNRRGSGGLVVEIALTLADAPFDLVEYDTKPGSPMPASFRAVNPWGQMPTLILPDGSMMTESAAILIHLAAKFPEKRLGPSPGTAAHAAFLRWLVFANVNLYEAVLRRVYPGRYTTDPAAEPATQAAAIQRMGEALALVERALVPGPFLLGADMSLADIYVAMLSKWFRGSIDAPRLAALRALVEAHPTVGPVWRRHFPA